MSTMFAQALKELPRNIFKEGPVEALLGLTFSAAGTGLNKAVVQPAWWAAKNVAYPVGKKAASQMGKGALNLAMRTPGYLHSVDKAFQAATPLTMPFLGLTGRQAGWGAVGLGIGYGAFQYAKPVERSDEGRERKRSELGVKYRSAVIAQSATGLSEAMHNRRRA